MPQNPANPRQSARAQQFSRLRFARHFDALCRHAAKETGTVYHGTTETGADYEAKVKNLDTVCDSENLMNMRGAHQLTPETIRDCRRTFGKDAVEVEARLASTSAR